jgi:crotonobetainyl-CoA:carnitine CoA-transferase CaiB-like acyl-CoA transferase
MEEAIDQSEADSYTYDEEHNEYVPTPAPSLSRTPGRITSLNQPTIGGDTIEVLKEFGYTNEVIENMLEEKIILQSRFKSKI